MKKPSCWNGPRYRLGQLWWRIRILRSDLSVIGDELAIEIRQRWFRPKVKLHERYGARIQGGRGQTLDLHVSQCAPARAATAYLRASLAADEAEEIHARIHHNNATRSRYD